MRAIIGKEFADKIGEGNDVFLRAAFGSGTSVMSDAGPDHPGRVRGLDGGVPDDAVQFGPGWRCAGAGAHVYRRGHHGRPHGPRCGRFADGSDVEPKAIRAVYDINKTDLQRFRGLESSLRADLPRSITDVVDANVLNGTGFLRFDPGSHDRPDQPQRRRDVWRLGSPRLPRPSTASTLGRCGKCKLVVNPHTLATMYALLASKHGGDAAGLLHGEFGRRHDDERTCLSRRSRINKAIACKTGPGVMYNGIAKMWGGGIQVIRDEMSLAQENRLRITANVYADYDVVRPAGYLQIEFYTVGSVAMAKSSAAGLTRLLAGSGRSGLAGPGRVRARGCRRASCEILAGRRHKKFVELHHYLHSPDYSRAGLAKRLRALK